MLRRAMSPYIYFKSAVIFGRLIVSVRLLDRLQGDDIHLRASERFDDQARRASHAPCFGLR